MSDLDATAAWAEKNHGDTKRLAATGFCWGGRIVWLYAAHNAALKAGAAWYGRLAGASNPLQPRNPVDIASELKAPVIGLYGGKDTGISMESVGQMQALLEVADQPSEIHVFPHAQHGFNADYRPSYDAPAAKDAWEKMLAFFHHHGV
jgi:carboxymethylenebutenolidase